MRDRLKLRPPWCHPLSGQSLRPGRMALLGICPVWAPCVSSVQQVAERNREIPPLGSQAVSTSCNECASHWRTAPEMSPALSLPGLLPLRGTVEFPSACRFSRLSRCLCQGGKSTRGLGTATGHEEGGVLFSGESPVKAQSLLCIPDGNQSYEPELPGSQIRVSPSPKQELANFLQAASSVNWST